MASAPNPNGLRAVTGGQAGTMDMQFVLIRCYNTPFTITSTPQDPYEYISNPNDGFAQLIALVQDFCEIYYIGVPQANSGGENDLTRVVIGINPVTARDMPTDLTYPSATGRWNALEAKMNDVFGTGSEAWFGMPGNNWSNGGWFYND